MDELLEYKVWIVAAIFLLLFSLEHIKPAVSYGARPFRRIFKNLSFWPLNILLSFLVVLPVTAMAAQYALWERPDGFSSLALDILILDLFIYGWHVALHRMRFLWRFHEIHHLDEHLDSTSAIRFHFGEIFFSVFARSLVIIVFAIPFSSVLVFETLVLVCSLFHHSNIVLPAKIERALSMVIITPSIHWVHHHALRADTDSRYGTIFSFWDRLFGTSGPPARTKDMHIGVEGKTDLPFLKLIVLPFSWRA